MLYCARRLLQPISLLTILIALLALTTACSRGAASGQAPTEQALPLSASSSGFTVSLTNVEATSERTVLTFRITDTDSAAEPAIDAYAGLTPPDLTLEGLAWGGPYSGSYRPIYDATSTSQPPPVVAAEEIVELGPVARPEQPVSVSFARLRFMPAVGDRPAILVEGTWTFRFTPATLGALRSTKLAVRKAIEAQGVTFAVDEVVLDRLRATVRYRIEASWPGGVEQTGIVARLSDGTLLVPDRTNPVENGYLAVFPPFPAGQDVALALAPILVEEPGSLAITFPVNGRVIAGGVPGAQFPVNTALDVAGEQLTVAAIDLEEGGFSIRVRNIQPGQAGTVLLRFPGKNSVTLTDDRGNFYQLNGAATNFGKSDPLTTWADGSSFSFTGAIAADVTLLTLRVDGYGRQLRGPWETIITVPSAQA